MWDDFKKLGGLVFNQTKEQKSILLLKLRIISFNNKRDSALTKLGNIVYKAHKEGSSLKEDEQVRAQIERLDEIEKEIEDAKNAMKEAQQKTSSERKEIASQMSDTWEKTKKSLQSDAKPPAKESSKALETAGKSSEKPSDASPKKKAKSTKKKKSEKEP